MKCESICDMMIEESERYEDEEIGSSVDSGRLFNNVVIVVTLIVLIIFHFVDSVSKGIIEDTLALRETLVSIV